jgi:hypothetical protein
MGTYTAALNIGSFLTSVVSAPLAELAGLAAVRDCGQWPLRRGCRRGLGDRGWSAGPSLLPAMPEESDPAAAGRQAHVPVDHGGAHLRLRRAGVLLLRSDRLAAEPAVGRTRHGARRRRGRVLPLPDPGHCRRTGCAAGCPVRQYDGGGPHPWAAVADGTPGPAAGPGAVVAVVLLRRRGPGRRHHADLPRHHPAGPGPGVGGQDVRDRPRHGATPSAPWRRRSSATSTGCPAPGPARCC